MTSPTKKLNAGERHLLRLVKNGADAEGWANVSSVVWPLVAALPNALVETRIQADEQRQVRLTNDGQQILYAEQWI